MQHYIKFEYLKINNHSFSLKIDILFFLPFENNIIKSISYKIINKLRINNEVSWNLTVKNFSLACTDPSIGKGWENQSTAIGHVLPCQFTGSITYV